MPTKPSQIRLKAEAALAAGEPPSKRRGHNKKTLEQIEALKVRHALQAPLPPMTPFILRMRERAEQFGIKPHEFLALIVEGEIELDDTAFIAGELVEFRRKPTVAERIDCAKHAAPYYYSKKATQIEQSGEIVIRHEIPESPLDMITLDSQGRVIDAEDLDFDELP